MKIKHIKSRVVLPEENYWYDINYNTEIATCSHCKRKRFKISFCYIA